MDLMKFAEARIDSWRAADGGLTEAAIDVLYFARWADGASLDELRSIDRFSLSAAERDVLEHAIRAYDRFFSV